MRTALKNFRDISTNHELITELMMTHVEEGVAFTNEYGDIDERFYDNIPGATTGQKTAPNANFQLQVFLGHR